jgi:hypothetical protein
MMHLNDSKAPLGSRRDRHELIGEGAIGEGAFRKIMNDSRLAGVAKVIETPKLVEDETDRTMLERLRSYIERQTPLRLTSLAEQVDFAGYDFRATFENTSANALASGDFLFRCRSDISLVCATSRRTAGTRRAFSRRRTGNNSSSCAQRCRLRRMHSARTARVVGA